MEKNTQWIVVTFAALALLLGIVAGSVLVPVEKEVTKTITVTEVQEVEVPVEVEVEVEKDFLAYKDSAVELCLAEFIDGKTLTKYQTVEVLKVEDNWNIDFGKDTTNTTISLKFIRYDELKNDVNKFGNTFKICKIVDEVGEDLVVNIPA